MVNEVILRAAKTLPSLKRMRHFEIDRAIAEFAGTMASEEWVGQKQEGSPITSSSARLPFDGMTLTSGCSTVILFELNGEVCILPLECALVGQTEAVASFAPGGKVLVHPNASNAGRSDWGFFALCTSCVLRLINEPRVVAKNKSGSRQNRRSVERIYGIQADFWHRISWDLSKPATSSPTSDEEAHMPLHYVRGHFKHAKPHWQGAFQRPDAIRPEDRLGWWQWIEGYDRGNPAFGVVNSVHTPRMSGKSIAPRLSALEKSHEPA